MRISDWSSDVCSSDLAAIDIGRRANIGDMELGHRLDPHRLPDAAHRRVPDARGVEDLLAARLRARAGRVCHLDDDFVRTRFQIIGDIEAERVEPALVAADDRSVDARSEEHKYEPQSLMRIS